MPSIPRFITAALCVLALAAACKEQSSFSGATRTQGAAKKPDPPKPAPETRPPPKKLNVPKPRATPPPAPLSPPAPLPSPVDGLNGTAPKPAPPPPPPVSPAPKPQPPPLPAPTPAPDPEPACVNKFRKEAVTDPASGMKYRILPETHGYCDGAAACAKAYAGGELPWLKMNVPDKLLDCQEEAGWWIQNYKGEAGERCNGGGADPGLGLFEVSGYEESDLMLRAPILCVFP